MPIFPIISLPEKNPFVTKSITATFSEPIQCHVGKESFAFLGVIAITRRKLIHKSDGVYHADFVIKDLQSLFCIFSKWKKRFIPVCLWMMIPLLGTGFAKHPARAQPKFSYSLLYENVCTKIHTHKYT